MQETRSIITGIAVVALVLLLIGVALWAWPKYRIYRQDLRGQAELREAEWTKKIMIEEAKAEKEAALLQKERDIIRAQGIAESNKIVAESLTPQYIQWKWVEGLHDGSSEVIYVPTETNLPILEAARLE